MATVQDVIDGARVQTSHDVDQQVTDPQLITFTDDAYQDLWRAVADVAPELVAKRAASTFMIAAGTNTQDVTASPLSLTDFDRVYRLERQYGPVYRPVNVASALDPELTAVPAFLERGTVLELYPSQLAGATYRLSYIPVPETLDDATDPIPLPQGAKAILVERVIAKVWVRDEKEDRAPYHEQLAQSLETKYLRSVRKRYGAHVVPGLKRIWW